MEKLCTPCFYEYVRSLNRFTTGNPVAMGLRLMEKLCLKDNDRYCYARYRWREQATSQLGRNAKDIMLCDEASMGQCALKMEVRDTPGRSAVADYMCMRRITTSTTSASQPLCADLMKPLVGGYDVGRSYVGSMYSAPSSCAKLQNTDQDCSWGCQKAYTPERNSFGCCYETTKAYYAGTSHADVGVVFNRSDLVGLGCNRPADPACAVVNKADAHGARATIKVDVPVNFLRANSTGTHAAIMDDIIRAVGQTVKGVQIRGFRYQSQTSSAVDFIVWEQNLARAKQLVAAFSSREERRENINFNIDRLFWGNSYSGTTTDNF